MAARSRDRRVAIDNATTADVELQPSQSTVRVIVTTTFKSKNSIMRFLVYIFVSLTTASLLSTPADVFAQQTFRVQTTEIISFKQTKGQPQWQQSQLNRIAGAVWIFNSDKTFLFTMPDVRDDLYPIHGTYNEENGSLIFSGSSSSHIGNTGTAMAQVNGRLFKQNNTWMISMSVFSSFGSVAFINEQQFSGGNTSAYEFTVAVQ